MNEQFNFDVIPDFVLNEKLVVSLIEGYNKQVIHLDETNCNVLKNLPSDHPENVFSQEALHDYIINDVSNHHLVTLKEVLESFEGKNDKYCKNCLLSGSVTSKLKKVGSHRTSTVGKFLKNFTAVYSFLSTGVLPEGESFIYVWKAAREVGLISSSFKSLQENVSLKISALVYGDASYEKHVEKVNNFLVKEHDSFNNFGGSNFIIFNSEFLNEDYVLNLLFLDEYDELFESILFYPGFKTSIMVSLPETFFVTLKSLLVKAHSFFTFLIREGDILNKDYLVTTAGEPSPAVLETMEKLFDEHNSSLRNYEDLFLIANNI